MHKPKTILENETHEIFWNFEKQTDPLILTKGPDLVLIDKKKESVIKWNGLFWQTSEWK